MIECTESPRDRALISLLAESGARVGEVSMIRLKDISWNANGFVLTLRGKTGQRQIPLCGCAVDLRDWINNFHPFKGDFQAPLFVNPGSRDGPVTNLGTYGISAIVRRVARRSDVEKRIHVYPHLFRHLRATQLAEAGWNEMMLRDYFGWSKTSNMPAVYIHLSRRSLSDKYYQMYGKVDPEPKKTQMFEEPKVCSVCGMQNPHGYCFCLRCNTTLDRNKLNRLEKANEVKKNAQLHSSGHRTLTKTLAANTGGKRKAETLTSRIKVVRYMQKIILQSKKIHTDDTPVPVQDDSRTQTRKGYLWAYIGDDNNAVFDYTSTHSRDGPVTFLGDYSGHVHADAYKGYDAFFEKGNATEVACWAHTRRKSFDSLTTDPRRAHIMLALIGNQP